MTDLTYKPALELSDMIGAKQISAVELMRATLDRIGATNGAVNAIVSLRDGDALLAEAKAADGAESKGWLHGIPIAIKDLGNVRGLPTSMGSPLFAGQIAEKDDIIVARLRNAGAIVIGKTNTPEFGLGSHTFNPVFGATQNPYDRTRTCGGSSGGAAVALACGMMSVADGSDMMGSLRNPAAWNNVYGMRPSEGLVPSEPKVGGDTYLQHLSTNGPMARNPRDLAALLDTMAGADTRQPFALTLPMSLPAIDADVSGRKIGWLGDWNGAFAFEAGILEVCQSALEQMTGLGVNVEDVGAPHARENIWDAWVTLRHFSMACSWGPQFQDENTRDRLKKTAQWEIEDGLLLSAQDVHKASALRSGWFADAAKLFERFDVLALPSAQVWPFPVETEYPTEISGKTMDTYHRWMEVMIPASLIGLPVVTVPIGFGENGLPMGLQLIGPRGSDARLLQLAQVWHKATDWPANARPSLA
ncbi:MAG: amidase [Aliishimia sp.]